MASETPQKTPDIFTLSHHQSHDSRVRGASRAPGSPSLPRARPPRRPSAHVNRFTRVIVSNRIGRPLRSKWPNAISKSKRLFSATPRLSRRRVRSKPAGRRRVSRATGFGIICTLFSVPGYSGPVPRPNPCEGSNYETRVSVNQGFDEGMEPVIEPPEKPPF